jgi:hypothetical protein
MGAQNDRFVGIHNRGILLTPSSNAPLGLAAAFGDRRMGSDRRQWAQSGRNAGPAAKRCKAVAAAQRGGNQASDFHQSVVPAALVSDRRHA